MKNISKILIILICFTAPLWSAALALAISSPDSSPTASNIRVNHNLITTGDLLVTGDYSIPYASVPATAADETYLFQLLDGVTQLGAVTPYIQFDSGYNRGIFSFYFENATASGISWASAYTIRIAQNPAHFPSPVYNDFNLLPSNYTTDNTTNGNQTELAIYLLASANRLAQYYDDETILDSTVSGTVLSSPTGETYFQGAIPGVQAMAPSLFIVQVLEYEPEYRTWTTDYSDNQTTRFDGTWAGAGANATAVQFGLTSQTAMGFIPLSLVLGSIILSSMKWRRIQPGLVISSVFLIMSLLMGWLSPAVFAIVFQCLGIYVAYLLFLARAS